MFVKDWTLPTDSVLQGAFTNGTYTAYSNGHIAAIREGGPLQDYESPSEDPVSIRTLYEFLTRATGPMYATNVGELRAATKDPIARFKSDSKKRGAKVNPPVPPRVYIGPVPFDARYIVTVLKGRRASEIVAWSSTPDSDGKTDPCRPFVTDLHGGGGWQAIIMPLRT